MNNSLIYIHGDNNIVEIYDDSSIQDGEIWIEDDDNIVCIGRKTLICGKTHLACTEGTRISIGDECLFSSEIVFRTGDSHSIYNLDGKRINAAKNIIVGNHVWIGHRVCINKGVVLGNNSVVGTGAVVTRPFVDGNQIIAGVPAKEIKSDVYWEINR